METYSEKELISLIKIGVLPAFDELYHRNWKVLYRIACHAVNSEEDAKDIVQNVFISLWNTRSTLNVDKCIRGYLYTTLKNNVINFYHREIIRKKKLQTLAKLERYDVSPHEKYVGIELTQRINGEIAQLPKKMQEIFILSRRHHLSIAQISEKLHITPRTVKNQLSNALRILRHRLEILR